MNLKQLEAFVEVTDNGSFSKAAKKLFLTQPTISAHIASLEKELRVRLFVRNTKEVSLSKDGEILYQYAKNMVEMEKKIKQIFISEEEDEHGCVNIATSSVPAQYLLPDILSKYTEKYPNQSFKVTETDSGQVVEKVVHQMADIGFTGTVLDKKDCKYISIYQDELVVAMPNTPKYQRLKEEESSISWIVNEPLIIRENGSGTRREAEKQLQKVGIDSNTLNVVANIENPEVIKRSVKNGLGITIISKLAIQNEVESRSLLYFPLSSKNMKRNLYLVYNKNSHLSKSSERFVRLVREFYHC